MASSVALTPDERLADAVGAYATDPLGFVRFAYPWGEPGPLQDQAGPDVWQVAFLT